MLTLLRDVNSLLRRIKRTNALMNILEYVLSLPWLMKVDDIENEIHTIFYLLLFQPHLKCE